VKLNAVPAVAAVGAVTAKCVAAASAYRDGARRPVIVVVTVSVALIV